MYQIHLDTLTSVLQEMTALIAPTALVLASETFASTTTDLLARSTRRHRRLNARIATLKTRPREGAEPDWRWLERHLSITASRVVLERWALVLFYAAIVISVACSLILGIAAVTRILSPGLVAGLILAGVVLALLGCGLLLVDARRLVAGTLEELAAVHEHQRRLI